MTYSNKLVLKTPIGNLCILEEDERIVGINFTNEPISDPEIARSSYRVMKKAAEEVKEYFNNERKEFDFDFAFSKGTDFQKSVWRMTEKIPYGKVKTYADIAREIGKPKAYRAVANALSANPLVIVVPCHRVVSKSGIGGFTSGVWRKKWLLRHEKT